MGSFKVIPTCALVPDDAGQAGMTISGKEISRKMPSPSIFVVDDEEVIATTLVMILKSRGFDAKGFVNPLKALETANSDEPDLLISDVFMPEMLGTELALQLLQRNPDCKVLLFSGKAATNNLLEQAREQGHRFTLLTKPVHLTDLLQAIHGSTDFKWTVPRAG